MNHVIHIVSDVHHITEADEAEFMQEITIETIVTIEEYTIIMEWVYSLIHKPKGSQALPVCTP
jgi:hypothetical protein